MKKEIAKSVADRLLKEQWIPYEGPQGGQGWQRLSDGEVYYDIDAPPGEVAWEEFAGDLTELNHEEVGALLEAIPSDEGEPSRHNGWIGNDSDYEFQEGDIIHFMHPETFLFESGVVQEVGDGEVAVRTPKEDTSVQTQDINNIYDPETANDQTAGTHQAEEVEGDEEGGEGEDESVWFEEQLEEGELTPADTVEEGEWFLFDGEVQRVESINDDGQIQTTNEELSVKDGTLAQATRDKPEKNETAYFEFGGESRLEDGWYRTGDEYEVHNDKYHLVFEDPEGNHDLVRLPDVEQKYKPVEGQEVSHSQGTPWEKYDGEMPQPSSSIPDSLEVGEVDNLSNEQMQQVQNGLTKAEEIGLLNHADTVGEFDPDSKILEVRNPIATYMPEEKKLNLNPEQMDSEKLQELYEDGYMVGEDIDEIMLHEAIHVAHVEASDKSIEEMWDMTKEDLPHGEMMVMKNEISEYGAQNPMEVVAEIGTKILKGEEVSDGALWMYEKYGGPEL